MGVPGLWEVLKPAGTVRSLTNIAVVDGFEANKNGKRGYRIGIDASIWFFHARGGKDGENPELRTLFFRCATLLKAPFLPLFVFDGPLRPAIKRGKRINGESTSPLTNGMKALVEAFGFEWRVAPGEAEAELAYLNRVGVIDGVLSDDVDTFLFGATTVIRNPSNNLSSNIANPVLNGVGKDDKNHTLVFTAESISSREDIGLSQPDLILIALLSGGDYNSGIDGCGIKLSAGLAKCGFGKSLFNAAKTMDKSELRRFLAQWREDVRDELRTNKNKLLPRKSPSIAAKLTEDIPNIETLMQYVRPVVSCEFPERAAHAKNVTWQRDPDLALIAQCCEQFFEWGYKDKIIKRFRTVIWPGAALRVLRAAVSSCQTTGLAAITVTGDKDEEGILMTKIHSTRRHASTDNTLEYRVEINPTRFVELAESGVRGTRRPEDEDDWKGAVPEYMREAEEDFDWDSEDAGKKSTKADKAPVDPHSCLRVWLPGTMLEAAAPSLIQQYEEKVAKRTKSKSRAKKSASEDDTSDWGSQQTEPSAVPDLGAKTHSKATKPRAKSTKSKGKARATTLAQLPDGATQPTSRVLEAISEIPTTPASSWRRTRTDPTPVRLGIQPFPMSMDDFISQPALPDDDDSDWEINPSPIRPSSIQEKTPNGERMLALTSKPSFSAMDVEDSDWDLGPSPNPAIVPMDISPVKVKTTTKVVSVNKLMGLKGHFPTTKPTKQFATVGKDKATSSQILRALEAKRPAEGPSTAEASKGDSTTGVPLPLPLQPFPMTKDDFFSSGHRTPVSPLRKRTPTLETSYSSPDIEFGSPPQIGRKSPKQNRRQISPKATNPSSPSPSPRIWSRTASAPSALIMGSKPRMKFVPQDIIELSDSDDDDSPPPSTTKSRAVSAGPTIQPKLKVKATTIKRLPACPEDADVIDLT